MRPEGTTASRSPAAPPRRPDAPPAPAAPSIGLVPRPLRLAKTALIALTAGYIAVCAAGCAIQDGIIFPRGHAHPQRHPPPADAQVVWVEGEPGERTEGWFFAGRGRDASSPGPAVIYFHGNAELIDHNTDIARALQPMGLSVLLAEYRGYGRSGGRPSQRAIGLDMDRFHEWLAARPEVDPDAIVYFGRSLGGGVAADLAMRKPPRAMILVSTFTSVRDMFWRQGVPGFLARHPFDVRAALRGYPGPVLIIHGTRDEVIPFSHARALADAAGDATLIETDDTHDFPLTLPEHIRAIRGFLIAAGVPVEGGRE